MLHILQYRMVSNIQIKCCNTEKNQSYNDTDECCGSVTDGCCETEDNTCCGKSIQAGTYHQKSMNITWQRLVTDDETCPRCGSTEDELASAVESLKQALTPLGIQIVVNKKELSVDEFKNQPLESNRIWLNGQPLEDIVDAVVGQSPCCDVCGPSECRTVTVDGQVLETIPSNVIVKAGLMAASKLIGSMDQSCC